MTAERNEQDKQHGTVAQLGDALQGIGFAILEVLPGLGQPRYEPIEAIKFHTRITSKYYGDDHGVDE